MKEKLYLVKKFCDMVGVNYSTLRHFERVGLLEPKKDEENQYRNYSMKDAYLVNTFKYYRSLGFDTKDSLTLTKEPKKDTIREKLLTQESELVDEFLFLKNRIRAIQQQLEDISHMDQKHKFRVGKREDLYFLELSDGNDFDRATYKNTSKWIELLPVTRYGKWIDLSDQERIPADNHAHCGLTINQSMSYLLTEEERNQATFLPGGECVYYYGSQLDWNLTEELVLKEVYPYLEEHNYKIVGDLYLEGIRMEDDYGRKGQIVTIPVKKR